MRRHEFRDALAALALACALLLGCPTTPDPDDDDASGDDDDSTVEELVWPNDESSANSDPWIAEHHAEIRTMRPRILALNFVNDRSMDEMNEHLEHMVEVIAESSRFHGYADADAAPFLQPELAYTIDLTDDDPPDAWPYNNSTLYPREDPADGYWTMDYEALWSEEFAALYGIEDPDDAGQVLDLCELVDRGLVHEIWIYGDADLPDVRAAEILEYKPVYDEDRQRVGDQMNRCAGNGCFDEEDTFPDHCTRTIRVAWYNNTRGPGCFQESLSHGFESVGAWNDDGLPTLRRDFVRFAGYDLDERLGLPIDSWYACSYSEPCLEYPTETSVAYDTGDHSGLLDPYDPVCGNVHFTPNGRQHYDLEGPDTVQTRCESFGVGDTLAPYTSMAYAGYRELAPDCMGPFLVWWRQNFPGRDTTAVSDNGQPMLNWWPYLYY